MATMTHAAPGSPYRVPPEPSRLPSFALAALVHAGLLLFLWAGISWQNTEPVAVEAEVWDMKVQSAAAPPLPQREIPPEPVQPAPTPPPPKVVEEPVAPKPPDIALEREKKQKEQKLKRQQEELERQQEKKLADQKRDLDKARKELLDQKKREQDELAAKKAEQLAKDKADKLAKAKLTAAEQAKLDKLRDAEMRRITGAAGSGGEAAQSTGPKGDPSYAAAISAKIKSNVVYPGGTDVPGDPQASFQIEQLPTGEIISVRKVKSSGIPAYDQAVENAINKSSPLPKKKDGTVQRSLPVTFRLKETVN